PHRAARRMGPARPGGLLSDARTDADSVLSRPGTPVRIGHDRRVGFSRHSLPQARRGDGSERGRHRAVPQFGSMTIRWVAGLLAAGALLLPQGTLAQNAPQTSSDVVQATLANGMRVVLLPNKLAPVATTVLTYDVGSDDDTMPGIAHAAEHMMFRGTADVSATQFAEMAARAGAQYDAETTNIATTYYFKIPSAYTGVALRLEADRMNGAVERESDWQTERSAIEQEVRSHQSVPGAALSSKVRRAFFGDVPYAHDGVGTIE